MISSFIVDQQVLEYMHNRKLSMRRLAGTMRRMLRRYATAGLIEVDKTHFENHIRLAINSSFKHTDPSILDVIETQMSWIVNNQLNVTIVIKLNSKVKHLARANPGSMYLQ